jgi:chemotaxis response regulator CheB
VVKFSLPWEFCPETGTAEDEASYVVFGMPKEAIAMGGAETVLPLSKIPSSLLQMLG